MMRLKGAPLRGRLDMEGEIAPPTPVNWRSLGPSLVKIVILRALHFSALSVTTETIFSHNFGTVIYPHLLNFTS